MEETPEATENNGSDGSRAVVLVAFEPRSYRDTIARALQGLRPRLSVKAVEPEDLGAEVARLDPKTVLCSQPNTFTRSDGPTWFEFSPYKESTAKLCIGGRHSELENVELDDLLSVVDRAEALAREREGAKAPG